MKKIQNYIKLAVLFLFVSITIQGQTNFDKANTFYQKADYNAAITAYQLELSSKMHSAEVYFNLGNCYYKLNKVAPAIYYYEKALLLAPNDAEIQNNLQFAQKMTIDEIAPVIEVGFEKILSNFTSSLHFDSWAILAIVFAFGVLLCFSFYFFNYSSSVKRIFVIGIFITLLGFLLSIFSGYYEKSKYENTNPAIVFADVCSVKSEPRSTATESFVLHAGTKVLVIEKLNNFIKIQLPDLKTGWVKNEEIKKIKN